MSELRLVDYQDSWPMQFLRVAGLIRSAVNSSEVVLEHIGSTAVPGLCSKPVLDIVLGVSSLAQAEANVSRLAAVGFVYRPEYESQFPERRYFVRPATDVPRIHLHAVVVGTIHWRQHLYFRDRLRQDRQLMQSYDTLKRQLAVLHATDKSAYSEAKAPFIQRVLASCPSRSSAAHDDEA